MCSTGLTANSCLAALLGTVSCPADGQTQPRCGTLSIISGSLEWARPGSRCRSGSRCSLDCVMCVVIMRLIGGVSGNVIDAAIGAVIGAVMIGSWFMA